MDNSILLIVVLGLGAIGALHWLKGRTNARQSASPPPAGDDEVELPYSGYSFLSENEKAFLTVLDIACGESLRVFAQVRLADLIDTDNERSMSNYQAALNRVSSRSIDFLLCDALTLRPLAALEVDDSTHRRRDRKMRDEFVGKVFQKVGLPLIRIPAKKGGHSPESLTSILFDAGVLAPREAVVRDQTG